MNRIILALLGALLAFSYSSAAVADIKKTIKDKVEEGILEEFAGELAKLPGLKQLKAQIDANEYRLVSTNSHRGILTIVNPEDIKSISLSRTRHGLGFNINHEAILASGTYWLKAEPNNKSRQNIERKVIISDRVKNDVELKFWDKGLSTYPLEIVTIPEGANIRILDIAPKYQFAMPLKQRKYTLEVSQKGYKTSRSTITLDHNQNNFLVTLVSLSNSKPLVDESVKAQLTLADNVVSSDQIAPNNKHVKKIASPKKVVKTSPVKQTRKTITKDDWNKVYLLPGKNFAFDKLNIKHSYQQLITGARNGDKEAKIQVAILYMHGVGVEQDFDKAAYWFKESAKDKHPQGQKMYGYTFYGTQNTEAFKYFRKAAQQGDIEAQYLTSKFYLEGTGVAKNQEKSKFWFNKAVASEVFEKR